MKLGLLRYLPLVLATLLGASPAVAEEIDEASRSAARQVGYEGLKAYRAGRYGEALEKLGRAYAVVKAPSLGLWTARAMIQMGRLVEASERLLEVTRLPISSGDTALQAAAKETASKERKQLEPRIPHLRIQVEGADPAAVGVTLDGRAIPAALLGVDRPVNPGQHELRGVLGGQSVVEFATLSEGQSRQVVLHFAPGEKTAAELAAEALPFGEPSPSGAPPAATPEAQPAPTRSADATRPAIPSTTIQAETDETSDAGTPGGGAQRALGWVGVGVGALGLGVGTATGFMALTMKDELDSGDCRDHVCGPNEHDRVDAYNSLRTASTAGFIVGGLGMAAGWALLLTAPEPPSQGSASMIPWVSLGAAGLAGRF